MLVLAFLLVLTLHQMLVRIVALAIQITKWIGTASQWKVYTSLTQFKLDLAAIMLRAAIMLPC